MRSRAVSRLLLCWFSIAFGPPPSRIFSSWLRTCETRSAMKRILASKRAEVGSTRVSKTAEFVCVPGSVGSAMSEEPETVYGIPAEQGHAIVGCFNHGGTEDREEQI